MIERDLVWALSKAGIEVVEIQNQWVACRCPFAFSDHLNSVDRKPSFYAKVSPDGISGAHCFSCGTKGSMVALIRRLGALRGDKEEMRKLSMEVDLLEAGATPAFKEDHVFENTNQPIDPAVALNLFDPLEESDEALAYLCKRGIKMGAAELLEMVWDSGDRRIVFPVKNIKGELFGFTGRSIITGASPKVKDYLGLNKASNLLGAHLLRGGYPVVVVEGLFALASFVSKGSRTSCDVVAIMGSKMSDTQAETLMEHGEPVVLCLDGDEAGEIGTYGTSTNPAVGAVHKLRGNLPVMVAQYPKESKGDPDNLTVQNIMDIVGGKLSELAV